MTIQYERFGGIALSLSRPGCGGNGRSDSIIVRVGGPPLPPPAPAVYIYGQGKPFRRPKTRQNELHDHNALSPHTVTGFPSRGGTKARDNRIRRAVGSATGAGQLRRCQVFGKSVAYFPPILLQYPGTSIFPRFPQLGHGMRDATAGEVDALRDAGEQFCKLVDGNGAPVGRAAAETEGYPMCDGAMVLAKVRLSYLEKMLFFARAPPCTSVPGNHGDHGSSP